MGGSDPITDAFVDAFHELFRGRQDAHGAGKGLSVKAPPNIRGHLEGRSRVGIYPLAGEQLDRCRWACLDVDIDDYEAAFLLQSHAAQKYDAPSMVERSKGKGWHVWFFFADWVLASAARRLLLAVVEDSREFLEERELLAKRGGRPVEHPIEIYPKQDRVPLTGYGNYVNLPLFGQDYPSGRTCFYERGADGRPTLIKLVPQAAPRIASQALQAFLDVTGSSAAQEPAEARTAPLEAPQRNTYGELLPCAKRMLQTTVGEGSRAEVVYRLGVHLKRSGYHQGEAARFLQAYNGTKIAPPLPERQVRSAVTSAFDEVANHNSLGCEHPVIAQYCALAECPVYRSRHGIEHPAGEYAESTPRVRREYAEGTAGNIEGTSAGSGMGRNESLESPERIAQEAPSPQGEAPERIGTNPAFDPAAIRMVEYSPREPRFRFARNGTVYDVSSLTTARTGGRRALLVITRGTSTVLRDNVLLDSDRDRTRISKAAFRTASVTGVDIDLMNIATAVEQKLVDQVASEIKVKEDARRKVLTAEEAEAATAWARERPNLLQHMIEVTSRGGMIREFENRCLLYLMFSSRKLPAPICGIGKGDSSSGKSFLAKSVLNLMPPEDVEELTRATAASLYYCGEYDFVRRIIFIREAAGSNEGTDHAIRTFVSEGDLILQTVSKQPDGSMIAEKKRVRGPIGIYSTTTELEGNPENETRLFSVHADESKEMTEAVMVTLAYAAKNGSPVIPDHELTLWRNFQRLLEPGPLVIIPFGGRIVPGFPTDQIRARRDFARLLELIRASAYVHQFHRQRRPLIDAEGQPRNAIVASVADYAIAKLVAEGTIMRSAYGVRQGFEAAVAALQGITDEAIAYKQSNAGRNMPRTHVEHGDETTTVWIQSPLIRDRLGYFGERQVSRLIGLLEGEAIVTVNRTKRPWLVSLADAKYSSGFMLKTVPPRDLLAEYPDDAGHMYNPLEAMDFEQIYGESYE